MATRRPEHSSYVGGAATDSRLAIASLVSRRAGVLDTRPVCRLPSGRARQGETNGEEGGKRREVCKARGKGGELLGTWIGVPTAVYTVCDACHGDVRWKLVALSLQPQIPLLSYGQKERGRARGQNAEKGGVALRAEQSSWELN